MDDSPLQLHTLGNLETIVGRARHDVISPDAYPVLADWLVKHGHPECSSLLDRWDRAIDDQENEADAALARSRLARYRSAFSYVRQFFQFEKLSPEMLDKFYRTDAPIFLRREGSRNLLVIWGTMYNNFGVSYAAAAAMLRHLDCSLLILKDGYSYYFLKGSRGMAKSREEMGAAIQKIADRENIANIYFTAYSSGTHAALATSFDIDCKGYLGFSQVTNFDEPVYVRHMDSMVAAGVVARDDVVDIIAALRSADPAISRTLYYGELQAIDARQAQAVAGIGTITVIPVADTGHNLMPTLLAQGEFLPAFARMMDRGQLSAAASHAPAQTAPSFSGVAAG